MAGASRPQTLLGGTEPGQTVSGDRHPQRGWAAASERAHRIVGEGRRRSCSPELAGQRDGTRTGSCLPKRGRTFDHGGHQPAIPDGRAAVDSVTINYRCRLSVAHRTRGLCRPRSTMLCRPGMAWPDPCGFRPSLQAERHARRMHGEGQLVRAEPERMWRWRRTGPWG